MTRYSMFERLGAVVAAMLSVAPRALAAQDSAWSHSAELGANAWYGAAHARQLSVELRASHADSTCEVRSDLRLDYADDREAEGSRRVTARAIRTSVSVDLGPLDRWSPFGFGGIETSLQQRIARRSNLGIGAKLTFHRRARDDVSISLAALTERTRTLAPDDSVGGIAMRARWSLRLRYRRQFTHDAMISHVTFYQPAMSTPADRYLIDNVTTLEIELTSVVSLNGTLRHRYDSEARSRGAESNVDGQFLLGVRAKF